MIIIMNPIKVTIWLLTFLLLLQAREFEKAFTFTVFKSTRGWYYLDKMTLSSGIT